jgi:hypothetical protein
VHEEPLVFDGIRRLQALSEASSAASQRYVPPAPQSSGLPAYREPEQRPLGTPLRSALMESEISGVGAGAVSAALGAMAAEARGASVFGVPASIPQAPIEEAVPPVTLRSEPFGGAPAPAKPALDDAEVEDNDEDEDDDDIEDDDEDDVDDEDDADDDAEDGDVEAEDIEAKDGDDAPAGTSDPDDGDLA